MFKKCQVSLKTTLLCCGTVMKFNVLLLAHYGFRPFTLLLPSHLPQQLEVGVALALDYKAHYNSVSIIAWTYKVVWFEHVW